MLLSQLESMELGELLRLCRKEGISSIQVGNVSLGLLPVKDVGPHDDVPLKDEGEKPCLCGHEAYEHNSLGECLHGCSPSACRGEEE